MNRIAPNNQFKAEYIIEVWKGHKDTLYFEYPAWYFKFPPSSFKTLAVFKVRQNKLPTKHNFNK
ncbi:MAG: hypothetical protein B7Y37_13750 [Sphingobacteriia bacterium 28-36-52]|nr:MAG: hypothetical protein B7Y37_13750 [Sphingobacteriia bacterium 28-36-52]